MGAYQKENNQNAYLTDECMTNALGLTYGKQLSNLCRVQNFSFVKNCISWLSVKTKAGVNLEITICGLLETRM